MDFGESRVRKPNMVHSIRRVKERKGKSNTNKIGTMAKLGHWRETRLIDGMSLVDKKIMSKGRVNLSC